ncbi:hypothetical protein BMS3Abin17_00039 [archaeon BMS3Abin17]|nr:hypothetical protein BMS3Abin17_00039 [archaeon BMS3Abin17]
MKEEKSKQTWSRVEKTGFVFYILLLASFLIGLFYWGYLSNEIERLGNLLLISDGSIIGFFYLIFIFLGILMFSDVYFNIVEYLFCPETKKEKLIKQKKKEYNNKYPLKIAIKKLSKFKLELKIEKLNKELKEWEDKK